MALTKEQLDKAVAYNATRPAYDMEDLALLVAHWQATHGLIEDGAFGPSTLSSVQAARPRTITPGYVWKPWVGPLPALPISRREVYSIFGNPGVGSVSAAWKKANIVTVRNLPGVPSKWYFECHRSAEPYFREGLRRAQLAAPTYKIERAASFVFRHQQHNPALPLSLHSWGIAIDVDPDRNFAKTYAKGKAPALWSKEWFEVWPNGVTKEFVEAMQSVGFTWGSDWDSDGRTDDEMFIDPMHFELMDRAA